MKVKNLDFLEIKGRRIMVMIDAANLESSVKNTEYKVNYQKLKDYFLSFDKDVSIHFYSARFENEKHYKFTTFLYKHLNFKVSVKDLKSIQGENKANFDVELAVDTILKINDFDMLILFSGDSDFDYLVKVIQEKGKSVVCVSKRNHISSELYTRADYYCDISYLKEYICSIRDKNIVKK